MKLSKFITVLSLSTMTIACGGGGGSDNDGTGGAGIDVTDAASLSQAASFENASRVSGSAPVSTSASADPMTGPAEIPMTTNSVAEILLEVPLPDNDSKIGAVFIEIEGSGEHFVIIPDDTPARVANRYTAHSDLNGTTAYRMTANRTICATNNPPCEGIRLTANPLNSNGMSAPVNTRANVSTAIIANVSPPIPPSYDFSQIPGHRWTQPYQLDVTATPTGSGDLQFTLTWDTTADVDLHIFEPGGTEIYWNSQRSNKGYLDVDDLDGFGPENVFYEDGHDAGNYRVEVHHFSGATPTNYVVTITDNGSTSTYSGTLTNSYEEDLITTIPSSGSSSSGTGGTGMNNGDFCYDNYPSDACALFETVGGASSSSFSSTGSCASFGYTGANESFDFGDTSSLAGTCVINN